MAYTAGFTAVTSATFTAAQYNTNVRDNFTAIWVGTTAGDMDYYTSSTTKARLAPPAGLSLLTHNGTVPSWLAAGSALQFLRLNSSTAFEFAGVPGVIDVFGYDDLTSAFSTSSTSYTDVTGLSISLTLTRTCTIWALFAGSFAESNAAGGAPVSDLILSIDGTETPAGAETTLTDANFQTPAAATFRKINVASGSRVIKPRVRIDDGGESVSIRGILIAAAFAE